MTQPHKIKNEQSEIPNVDDLDEAAVNVYLAFHRAFRILYEKNKFTMLFPSPLGSSVLIREGDDADYPLQMMII